MEFKSLNLKESLSLAFKEMVKSFGVRNCVWVSQSLLNQLNRVTKENWLNIESLREQEHALFQISDEERKWFWEKALSTKDMTTIRNQAGVDYTFFPVIQPDQGEKLGFLIFDNDGVLLTAVQNLISKCSRHIGFCLEHLEVQRLSYIDDLTSLYNQRHLPQVLNREIERCQRAQQKFSLLFLDVDYFKRVNDGHGHLIGSQLLVEVAEILKVTIRSYDPLFRYGGDEFLALLVDTDRVTGEKVAERIRRAVENHEFQVDGRSLKLTVSIGLSVFPDHAKSTEELIKLADQAMYYGKNKSRNIVYIAS